MPERAYLHRVDAGSEKFIEKRKQQAAVVDRAYYGLSGDQARMFGGSQMSKLTLDRKGVA